MGGFIVLNLRNQFPMLERYTFSGFLASNLHLEEEIIPCLENGCRHLHLKKGDFALRVGETCRHSFFVERGLLKQYTIDGKGKEHVLLFAPEHWFAANIETVHFGRPSNYFMEAMEDTDLLLIDQPIIDRLSERYPTFRGFNTRLLHAHIRELQERVTLLLSASAEERYLDFIERFPYLPLRISQIQIAAYLGITPEALSRIRRELAERNSGRRMIKGGK